MCAEENQKEETGFSFFPNTSHSSVAEGKLLTSSCGDIVLLHRAQIFVMQLCDYAE